METFEGPVQWPDHAWDGNGDTCRRCGPDGDWRDDPGAHRIAEVLAMRRLYDDLRGGG